MRMKTRQSIQYLFKRYLVISSLALTFFTFALYQFYRYRVDRVDQISAINGVADSLTDTLKASLEDGDLWEVRKISNAILATRLVKQIQITRLGDPEPEVIAPFVPNELVAAYSYRYVSRKIQSGDFSRAWLLQLGYRRVPYIFLKLNRQGLELALLYSLSVLLFLFFYGGYFGKTVAQDLKILNDQAARINFENELGDNFKAVVTAEVMNALTQLKDVSKNLVESHKKAQEAENAAAAVRVAAQVSHDIRSPLSVLNHILSDLKDLPHEKYDLVSSAIRRIHDIANDLLKKSGKKEFFKASQKPEKAAVLKIARQIYEEKRAENNERPRVRLNLSLVDNEIPEAVFSESELSRILSNLVNNAIESLNAEGGDVTIGVRYSSNSIQIIIIDTGRGMSPEFLEKIGSPGLSNKAGGNGFGLYFAIETLSKYGGKMDVKSKLGEGTSITLRLVPA